MARQQITIERALQMNDAFPNSTFTNKYILCQIYCVCVCVCIDLFIIRICKDFFVKWQLSLSTPQGKMIAQTTAGICI